jgi:hypothetical protein
MPALADSKSILLPDRVLPQHQTALTLIKNCVECPTVTSFRWLDLACGQGQILTTASSVLGSVAKKITYVGIDVDQRYAVKAEQLGRALFGVSTVHISELHCFERCLSDEPFDFITFTNSAHEISPAQLGSVLVGAICRLHQQGQLFAYDMESLPELELGAVPWTGPEMESVFHEVLRAGSETQYLPKAASWSHKTCRTWSLLVDRRHFSSAWIGDPTSQDKMKTAAAHQIAQLLRRKLLESNKALESLAKFGMPEGDGPGLAKSLAYDYWAIARALGMHDAIPLDGDT